MDEDITLTVEIVKEPVIGISGVETPVARIMHGEEQVATVRVAEGLVLADLREDLDCVFDEDDRVLIAGQDDQKWAMMLPENMSGPTPAEFADYMRRYRFYTREAISEHVRLAAGEAAVLVRVAMVAMAVGRAQVMSAREED